MLYDLNIAWSPSTTTDQLLAILSLSSTLGYDTVALNHAITLPLPSNPTSPFPPLPAAAAAKLPHVLHRATFPLADPTASNYRIPFLASVYDILAVRPVTEKAFQNACLTLDVPLISLDLTQRLDFHFRPKPCMAAVSRGVRFEICYAQALNADSTGRAYFISNVTNLVRATRGRGFVLSSEASTPLSLRGPADVVNLLSVWGLSNDKGMEGLRSIPRSVVVNEGIKRDGYRGVVQVVDAARKPDGPSDQDLNGQATPGGRNNQKRKNAGQEDTTNAISKRQMKKMKLAARTGAGGEKKQL